MASVGQLQGAGGGDAGCFSLKISLPHPTTPFTLPPSTSGTPGAALLKLEPPGTISAARILPRAWQVLGLEARTARPPEARWDLQWGAGGTGALKPTHVLQGEG